MFAKQFLAINGSSPKKLNGEYHPKNLCMSPTQMGSLNENNGHEYLTLGHL
jgi:hypothetical protein